VEAFRPGSHPYVVVRPEVLVTLADGTKSVVRLRQRYPDYENALTFPGADLALLGKLIDGLGGAERTKPASVMGVPQPKGDAKAIQRLLERFFPVMSGHWGGWHLATFPHVNEIEFAAPDRNKAVVNFRSGYRGGYMRFERRGKGYHLVEKQLTWIE
jgi:hypothetical protein